MNLVTLAAVSKQYSDRVLLESVDMLINREDRIGLIGVNGSGKTTLLRIIAGLEPVDSGEFTVWGGVRVRYLPQEPTLDDNLTVLQQVFHSEDPELALLRDYEQVLYQLQHNPQDLAAQARLAALSARLDHNGGWAVENRVKSILTRLGIENMDARVGTLSGGERKRVALARVLLDPGDLLILDEPTNHIDADTIDWLEGALLNLPAALLMVTHDRYFLDRVANKIIELDRRKLVSYPGNYSQYLELRTLRHQQLAIGEEKRQGILRRELEWLRRSPAARSTKQKARSQRVYELLQLKADMGENRVSIGLSSRRLGKKVLKIDQLQAGYEGLPVIQNVDFYLNPGDRIGINGANGAGKSTFLDVLAGKLAPQAGVLEWGETVALGYFDQRSEGLRDNQRVIDYIDSIAPLIRTADGERIDASQMLDWFLFPRPMQQAPIGTLSGGERRRLYLLATLAQWPNVLLLDEPTNDLDIQTLGVLEEFLDHFKGCLVVVSHDRFFLDRNVDFIVQFENGRVSGRYPTPYETFRRLRDAQLAQDAPKPTAAPRILAEHPGEAGKAALPEKRRLTWKERQELTLLEEKIPELEGRKADLEKEMQSSGSDYPRLQKLLAELQTVDAALETALSRWMELAEDTS